MVLRPGIALSPIIRAAVLLATASCYCGSPEEPPYEPPIDGVAILPPRVWVHDGMRFSLLARVTDQWGNVLPRYRAAGLTWNAPLGLKIVGGSADSVVIEVGLVPTTPLPPGSGVVASIDGKSGSTLITVMPGGFSGDGTMDVVDSDHAPGGLPALAMVNGVSVYPGSSVLRSDTTIAFLRQGALDSFECPTGSNCSISLFSPSHALTHALVSWSGGCDFVTYLSAGAEPTGCNAVTPNAGKLGPLADPIEVPVYIWRAASSPGLDRQIEADLAYVRDVFSQPWLGISLKVEEVKPPSFLNSSIRHGISCQTEDDNDITRQLPARTPSPFQPGRITVVYVDAINHATGDASGLTCPYHDIEGAIVLISASAISHSTLAHELGHALGQWTTPAPEHPDVPLPSVEGFEPSNLMWSGEAEWGGSSRRHLTLGQRVQISFSKSSFVQRSGISSGTSLVCDPVPTSAWPCPPLAKDVVR